MRINKKFFIFLIFCIAVVLTTTILGSTGCKAAPEAAASQTLSETANSDQVICKNTKFQPAELTVKVGTTVTWTNEDNFVHTVTSGTSPGESSGLFDSGNLNPGEFFTFTFNEAGTYDYFCIPHYSLGMVAKIIVTE